MKQANYGQHMPLTYIFMIHPTCMLYIEVGIVKLPNTDSCLLLLFLI